MLQKQKVCNEVMIIILKIMTGLGRPYNHRTQKSRLYQNLKFFAEIFSTNKVISTNVQKVRKNFAYVIPENNFKIIKNCYLRILYA